MPRHAPILCLVQLIRLPVLNLLKVLDAIIVKVLSRPDLVRDILRMHIGERMLMHIPPPEAQIQSADEGDLVINDDKLLVVRPKERRIRAVKERVVIRVSDHRDVAVSLTAVRTQTLERLLGVRAVARERVRDLLVDADVNLDPLLRLPLEYAIQPPLPLLRRRPPQKQLGTQPPIFDVDTLGRALQRHTDRPEVVPAIDIPLDLVPLRLGGKRLVPVLSRLLLAAAIDRLLRWLVVSVVGIEDVCELPPRVLCVHQLDFDGEEVRVTAVAAFAVEVAVRERVRGAEAIDFVGRHDGVRCVGQRWKWRRRSRSRRAKIFVCASPEEVGDRCTFSAEVVVVAGHIE